MPVSFSSFFRRTNANALPDFTHPLEAERFEALRESKAFNVILDFFSGTYANFTTIAQIPDRYFPVTAKTFPRLYDLYQSACKKLEIADEPTLFCTMDYTRNAKTIGVDGKCVIVIDSHCLEDFSDRQILALLGCELGHVKMNHVTYLNAFGMIDDLIGMIPFGSRIFDAAVVSGVKGLLLEWLLAAEFTADRASAIVAGGIQPVMQNHLMATGIENAADAQNYGLYTQVSLPQNLINFSRAAQLVLMGTLMTFPIPFVIPRMQELEKWRDSQECARDFPQVHADKFAPPVVKSTAKSLVKGQKVELTKNISGLKKILVGLGWNINQRGNDFDLDAAAFLLAANGKVLGDEDFIFYGNLRHRSGAVEHCGDNRTGLGEGDDEQIKIDLEKIPAEIARVAFTVTIYDADKRRQNFGQVESAFIHIVNAETGAEILRYDLGENFSVETAVVVGELYRHSGEWKFSAIGSGFSGGLAALCKNFGVDVA